jgi:hypothetical protein
MTDLNKTEQEPRSGLSDLTVMLRNARVNARHLNGRIAEQELVIDNGMFPQMYREFFDENGCYEKTESEMTFGGFTTIDTRFFAHGKIVTETHVYKRA